MSYKIKTTRGSQRFLKFGPITLADQFGAADYDVIKSLSLLAPADKNGEGISDEDTHLEEYQIKPVRGKPKFEKLTDVRIVSQCNDLLVEVRKPVSLLVPTAKDLENPVEAPDPDGHDVDHFLCYKAKTQKKLADGTKLPKFPKGIQADVADQFQTRRYDLKKITKICNPTGKSGNPVFLAGRDKGAPKPITPAAIRDPEHDLVCYQASVAKRNVPQRPGCGGCEMVGKCSTDSANKNEPCGDGIPTVCEGGFCDKLKCKKGEKIDPKQPKHEKRAGIHVNNQLGPAARLKAPAAKPVSAVVLLHDV